MREKFIDKLILFLEEGSLEEYKEKLDDKLKGKTDDEKLIVIFEEIVGDKLNEEESEYVLGTFKKDLLKQNKDWFEYIK